MTISVTDRVGLEQPQDKEVVLSVKGVSKKFCRDLKRSLFYGVQDIASELIGVRGDVDKLRKQEFWALNDVSFELRRGEALGLVGKNGSGKTTLLRIISGLIRPDSGSVTVKGRVAPLIALGAGFNPILTGRENIYANMSILGLSKQEIDERFDEVLEFAEIGEAIDAPVQSYSSGMAARLGFASAIHTDPDILLIDEVLAVGDIKFRQKCFRRLHELRKNGTSFVLVSHQTQSVLNVCDSAIYLSKGQLIVSGDIYSIINQYEQDLFSNGIEKFKGKMLLSAKPESESLGVDITFVCFRDRNGDIVEFPITGEQACLCVGYKAYQEIDNAGITIDIQELATEGEYTLVLSNFNDKKILKLLPGEQEIQLQMPYFCLRPGLYNMKVYIRKDSLYTFDCVDSYRFTVEGKESFGRSLFYQPRQWLNVSKKTT